MKPPLSPDEIQTLIAGYVLYDLTPEEAELFEQLLAEDPAIATAVTQMQQALELAYGEPEMAPSPALQARILASSTTAIPPTAAPPLRRSRRPWVPLWNVAAAALIVGLSVSNYGLWQSLQATRQQLAQSESLILTLQPTTDEVPGTVTVALNRDNLQGTLTVENLPPLPPEKVYVLWTVLQPNAPFTTDPKNAILTQVFTVDASGQGIESIVLPAAFQTSAVEAIAITVEDATAPQLHRSQPILLQRL